MGPAPTFSLPPSAPSPIRNGLPILALLVPAVGAVMMWMLTGSAFALWFAALGPVMAGASLLDTRRAANRAHRRGAAERSRAQVAVRDDVRRAHDVEREELRARHPDLAGFALAPGEIWRPVPGRAGALVVGRGAATSAVRISGDDPDAAALRDLAATLPDAPIVVPASAGIAVVGPPPLADGVARGLVLQALCQHPVGTLTLTPPPGSWAADVPHRAPAPRRLVTAAPIEPGAFAVVVVPPGVLPPPECAAVLTVAGLDEALLDHDGRVSDVRVEAVSVTQARAMALLLSDRAAAASVGRLLPERVAFADLPRPPRQGLAVTLGATTGGPFLLDLVSDGPHAVVAGITGAGKSELLTTWVTAMAAGRSTDEVTFLLADFKGGTAFDRLAGLPHVTGVVTDLDDRGARRAIESLRAEIRYREATLAARGARDVSDPAAGLPRLVIVVDEFAALLQHAPELAAVFTDVAARGRALGMHLILGTQRATGVVREALLTNCPLRLSLRVTDAADSRFLLGGDEAATEPERGVAHIRTADAMRATRVRVALTSDADIAAIRADAVGHPARSPWLPPLPDHLPVAALAGQAEELVLGLADEPAAQRQSPVLLPARDGGLAVIGGPGSGRSGLLRALAAQDPGAMLLPSEPEPAWDLLAAAEQRPPADGALLVCDDLDVLLTRYPPDYAAALVERLTHLVRAGGLRPVVSVGRGAGAAARIVDLCGRRALLRLPTRLDHVAAGGDAAAHDPHAPRGRGSIDGVTVQFLDAPPVPSPTALPVAGWRPVPGVSALVLAGSSRAAAVRAALTAQGVSVAAPHESDAAPGETRVILGDADQWQRAWQVLATVRLRGELVIDAGCGPDYRLLTGDRTLPPYCEPGRGRAWLLDGVGQVRRVLLPGAEVRGERRRG